MIRSIKNPKAWITSFRSLTREQWIFLAILGLAILERVWHFGEVPYGLNQDEAYAGYNAWSLIHEGIDSKGDSFPVYFEAWGDGMNALETYLMFPFVAAFGLNRFTIRIPQMVVGILTVPAVYGMVKRLSGERLALISMAIFAIAPWHIMLSRWGLESNLAPGFITFGFYFFVRGLEQSKFLIASGLFYGLALYGYATVWLFLPFFILLEVLYALWTKRLTLSKHLFLGAVALGVLALPLVLFLLVNEGLIPEVATPFFSIPKMQHLRSNEFSFDYVKDHAARVWQVVVGQDDGLNWNSTEDYGLYYKYSGIFLLLGLLCAIKQTVVHLRKREFSLEPVILIHLLAGILLGIMVYVNVNRVNIIFPSILLLVAIGIDDMCSLFARIKAVPFLIGLYFLVSLHQFNGYYFSDDYKDASWYGFVQGFEEALDAADAVAETASANGVDTTIYLPERRVYPLVLFYRQIPASTYQEANASFEDIYDLGIYQRIHVKQEELTEADVDPNGIYILTAWEDRSLFSEEDYTITKYIGYYLAVPKTLE